MGTTDSTPPQKLVIHDGSLSIANFKIIKPKKMCS